MSEKAGPRDPKVRAASEVVASQSHRSVRPVSAAGSASGAQGSSPSSSRPVSAASRPQTAAGIHESPGASHPAAGATPNSSVRIGITSPAKAEAQILKLDAVAAEAEAQRAASAGQGQGGGGGGQQAPQAGREAESSMKNNWRVHALYVRRDFKACFRLIEEVLREHPRCEYALYVRALIRRNQGNIEESLRFFEHCLSINPSANNLKQIARSYFLLGKHKTAISYYEKAEKLEPDDWENWHNRGICYMYQKDFIAASECLRKANLVSRHDVTYLQLSKLYMLQENFKSACQVLLDALEANPENPELLTSLGLLFLRTGENYRAFDYFGNALAQDPTNTKTILAAGSIIQDHAEVEVALIKYRIAAVHIPHSAQLWNNIGMCFFSKQKYVAAIASLKKALYHAPFEWIISYNLGLVHLHTGQYASAFHFFSAAINLKPDFPITYMHLAITLSRLGDYRNACTAYEKALELYNDPLAHLNYAILHYTFGEHEQARRQLVEFEKLYATLDEDAKSADFSITEQRSLLAAALFPEGANVSNPAARKVLVCQSTDQPPAVQPSSDAKR